MENNIMERKKYECSTLPKGWVREEIITKTGISCGKRDVIYYSPSGKKIKSKPQLSRFLGESVDLSSFDFRTGKVVNNSLLRKNKKQRTQYDYSRGVPRDTSLIPPIRQTASIFKQPVTLYKTQPDSIVKTDFKHGHQEKPKQVFWEKRLEGLRAFDMCGMVELKTHELPKGVNPVGPRISNDTVLQSVATALHVTPFPITGQTGPKHELEENPGAFINPDQPLIQVLMVGEEDIKNQENKVLDARKRLEERIRNFEEIQHEVK